MDRSVTRRVLIVNRLALGVGLSSVRSWSAGSAATFATSDAGTPLHATALWSGPLSAITRLTAASASGPNVQTNLSGYWWRTGSVAGSQFVFRSSTSWTPG